MTPICGQVEGFRVSKRSTKPFLKRLTANRCLGTKVEFDGIYEKGMRVANMDETAMRILAMHVTSLHWVGAQDVPISEAATSKLSLSMPVTREVEIKPLRQQSPKFRNQS